MQPPHVVVSPESEDFPAEPRDIQFGEAVAIRNRMAFVGIPKAADGGHVAVFNLTASGWLRIATIKLPESVAHGTGETEFGRVLNWRDGVLMVGGEKGAYYFSGRDGVWTFRSVVAPPARYPGSVFPAAMRYEAGATQITSRPDLPRFVGTLLATELAARAARADCTSSISTRPGANSFMPVLCRRPIAKQVTTSVPTSA